MLQRIGSWGIVTAGRASDPAAAAGLLNIFFKISFDIFIEMLSMMFVTLDVSWRCGQQAGQLGCC